MSDLIEDEVDFIETTEERNRNQLVDVFISKSKYHKRNWDEHIKGKDRFNWAPFLVGGFWFLFNGMLLYGTIYIVIIIALVFLVPDSMEILLKAVMTSINGLIIYKGNALYYKFINDKVEKKYVIYR